MRMGFWRRGLWDVGCVFRWTRLRRHSGTTCTIHLETVDQFWWPLTTKLDASISGYTPNRSPFQYSNTKKIVLTGIITSLFLQLTCMPRFNHSRRATGASLEMLVLTTLMSLNNGYTVRRDHRHTGAGSANWETPDRKTTCLLALGNQPKFRRACLHTHQFMRGIA